MFKESYEAIPEDRNERMTGDVAEREVLGTQPSEGLSQYFHSESFEKKLGKVADELIAEGIIEKMKAYYPEQTEEEWKLTVQEYARNTFLNTKSVKIGMERQKDSLSNGGELSIETMIAQKMRGVFTLKAAVKQVLDIAAANKKQDPERYSEGITTPFTSSLVRNMKSMLSRKFPETHFHVEYVPAILDDKDSLTYLDGLKAVDAFVVFVDPKTGFFRTSYIDFTTNPHKNDGFPLRKGTKVFSTSVIDSDQGEKKQTVYIESGLVRDQNVQMDAGLECAMAMISDVEKAYLAHPKAKTA